MSYLNKYTCNNCHASIWALSDPIQCQRCVRGTTVLVEQGTEPLPKNVYFSRIADDDPRIVFDWDEFNNWWEEENAK